MKFYKHKLLFGITISATLFLASCCYPDGTCEEDDTEVVSTYPFEIIDETTIRINGNIGTNSLNRLDTVISLNPNTEILIFGIVGSSGSEEDNLQIGLSLHQLGLNTHVEDDGVIEGGAVSLFLAGAERTLGDSTLIGVHSWYDGSNEAYLLPQSHRDHKVFIEYYQTIGFTEQWAEDFYFFSINASPSRYTYWLTPDDIETYQITTD